MPLIQQDAGNIFQSCSHDSVTYLLQICLPPVQPHSKGRLLDWDLVTVETECSDLILTFKEGYNVCQENMAHTSTSPPSAAWPADKWKDGSVLSWHCCSPSDSKCKCCVCVYIYCFDLIYFSDFGNQVINLLLMMWHHCFLFLPNIQGSRAFLGLIPQSS